MNTVTASEKPDMVLFVGNARAAEYQFFKEKGILIGLLHDSHCPIMYPIDGSFAEMITVDSDREATIAAFNQLEEKYNIVAQVAAVETAVYHNALLAETTGLSAPSIKAAETALNKPMMRERFVSLLGPSSTSASTIVCKMDELKRFSDTHAFSIILKPTNLFGSMFVTKSHTADELSNNFEWMIREIRSHLDLTGRQEIVVEIQAETYLDGTNHSIDCVVDGEGNAVPTEIVDVLTERDFGGDLVQHYARYAPSILHGSDQDKCKEFASAAVRALGLSYCVAHVEFILTSDGPKLLEIAARPGGNRVHLMKNVFGLDLMEAYYASLTDKVIVLKSHRSIPRAIISVYPDKCGAFASVKNEGIIRKLPGYVKHTIRIKQGELIGPASEGHLPALSIELSCQTIGELQDAMSYARCACSLIELAKN